MGITWVVKIVRHHSKGIRDNQERVPLKEIVNHRLSRELDQLGNAEGQKNLLTKSISKNDPSKIKRRKNIWKNGLLRGKAIPKPTTHRRGSKEGRRRARPL